MALTFFLFAALGTDSLCLQFHGAAKERMESVAVYRQPPFSCCECTTGKGLALSIIATAKVLSWLFRCSKEGDYNFHVATSNIESRLFFH